MNRFITPRLREIAALVHGGAALIDVGSDHAYLPIYLVLEGKADRALCTDVNEGPLRHSVENITRFGLADKIGIQKADGLIGVDMGAYDTIVIAGMGGILISEILQNAGPLTEKRLILQPMTAIEELRRFLLANGFRITEERLAREGEKLYTVIAAEKGQDTPYTEAEFLLGRKSKASPLYPIWKERTLAKLRKRLCGLMAAKEDYSEEIKQIQNILQEMEP